MRKVHSVYTMFPGLPEQMMNIHDNFRSIRNELAHNAVPVIGDYVNWPEIHSFLYVDREIAILWDEYLEVKKTWS